MVGLLGHERRSSSMFIQILMAWTFGSGSVFWRIWPAVLELTLFATAVTVVSLITHVDLSFSDVMLTVLGVVLGFVISYRFSCGYDQYWMGRTVWSDVVKNIHTLSRLIWFHVPLRLTAKPPEAVAPSRGKEEVEAVMGEKRMALELLEGFAISLKHRLLGEPGIFYEDLYDLVKPLHEHNAHHIARISPTAVDRPWHTRGKSERDPLIPPITAYGSTSLSRTVSSSSRSVRPALHPANDRTPLSLFDRVSADLIPFAAYMSGIFRIFRIPKVSDTGPGVDIDGHAGVERRWAIGVPAHGRKPSRGVAGSDGNIPVEILRLLSDWFANLEERMSVPGTSLGAMIGAVAALEDSLSAAERIQTTPLPIVYAVHISTVWIYLFFLPFQLVGKFSWYTIPGVALASFIYLGFLSAGDEIGRPFGYDENDLDMDFICREMVHADLARLKATPGLNVFLGPHEATPHDVPAQAAADLLEM